MTIKDLEKSFKGLSKNTEIEIAIQAVFSNGDDARADDIQAYYNKEKDRLIIYG